MVLLEKVEKAHLQPLQNLNKKIKKERDLKN